MSDPARARKIADRIKVITAEYIRSRLKDERLGFVTVTDTRVTGDLQHASIFYTVFGTEEERASSAEALEANKGRIRSAVGKGLGIRLTPSIEFIADALPEASAQIEDLVAQTRARDAELAQASAGATYAGEADPYRKPAADEDAEGDGADAADLDPTDPVDTGEDA